MPRGIRKNAVKAKVESPVSDTFFTGFHVRKAGNSWRALSGGEAIIAVSEDRDSLVERVRLSAQTLAEQGGNVEVAVYNEQGLVETRYNYWAQWTLENHNKPVEAFEPVDMSRRY